MLNEHRPCAAASVAKDGEAPESSHDGSLREKRIRAVRFAYVWQATFQNKQAPKNPSAEHRFYTLWPILQNLLLCC